MITCFIIYITFRQKSLAFFVFLGVKVFCHLSLRWDGTRRVPTTIKSIGNPKIDTYSDRNFTPLILLTWLDMIVFVIIATLRWFVNGIWPTWHLGGCVKFWFIIPKVVCRKPALKNMADSRQVAFRQCLLKRAPTSFICIFLQKLYTPFIDCNILAISTILRYNIKETLRINKVISSLPNGSP